MQPVKSAIVAVILIGLTVAFALGQGYLSNRWSVPADLEQAGRQVQGLPREIGPWKLNHEGTLSEEARRQLKCAGFVVRTYVNDETGDSVQMALLVGPPGPMSVHVPEICFNAQDYTQDGTRESVQLDEENTVWGVNFRPNDLEARSVRVYYGWRLENGNWTAAGNPRYQYGGEPVLYKIQLSSYVGGLGQSDQTDAALSFLMDFIQQHHKPA